MSGYAKLMTSILHSTIWIEHTSGLKLPPLAELPRGAIVGAMTLAGCLPQCDWDAKTDPWHIASQFGIQLADVVPLPTPVPCRGALGFWTVPEAVADEVRRLAT